MRSRFAELFVAFLVGAGAGIGAFAAYSFSNNGQLPLGPHDFRQNDGAAFKLINPLLECAENPAFSSEASVTSLEDQIQKIIDTQKQNGAITFASVYYRDLNEGPTFSINASQKFSPASLLKVPLALSFYIKAEDDPSILSKTVTYTPDPSIVAEVQPYTPVKNLEAGKKYTVSELIQIMLEESSNESAGVLATIAGEKQIESAYTDLGLAPPIFGQDYKTDTRSYAGFFRILFNATYLSSKDSEQVLEYLTQTSFKAGIVAGVPDGITIAHKFGTRQIDALGSVVQLHDCGIVYAKNHPYALCVMTQGPDFSGLADTIKQISAQVYRHVDSP